MDWNQVLTCGDLGVARRLLRRADSFLAAPASARTVIGLRRRLKSGFRCMYSHLFSGVSSMISAEELVTLISKVGGEMADTEAKALIHAADKDGNMGIDFSEFAKLLTCQFINRFLSPSLV